MSITPNNPADYDPAMGSYKDLKPFRYWCQKVLPLVYDDSLSYYEVLCKVVDYLNKAMEDIGVLHDDVDALHTAYQQLQSYVNDYFSTLDVQEEINNKLDVMASDGTLDNLILPYFNAYKVVIDNEVSTFKAETTAEIDNFKSQTNGNINALNARMDTFTRLAEGSTTGDAELADIRVAEDGRTYATAGDAVRAQIGNLNYTAKRAGSKVNYTGTSTQWNIFPRVVKAGEVLHIMSNVTQEVVTLSELNSAQQYRLDSTSVTANQDGTLVATRDAVGIMFYGAFNADVTDYGTIYYQLRDEYFNREELDFTIRQAGYKLTYVGNSSVWNIHPRPIKAGDVLHITSNIFQGCYTLSSLNSDSQYRIDEIVLQPDKEGVLVATADAVGIMFYGASTVDVIQYGELYYGMQENYLSKDDTLSLIGVTSPNLVDEDDVVDGYYVDYLTGDLEELQTFSTTGFIKVIPNVSYYVEGGVFNSQLAYFDINYNFISGVMIGKDSVFTVPDNDSIHFVRWCSLTNKKPYIIRVLPANASDNTIHVRNGDSILANVINAYNTGVSKIIVESGDYDIIQEYKTYYGNTYFDDYEAPYNHYVNGTFDAGIWLHDIEVIFSPAANVTCHYEGDNQYVKSYFSAFATGNNVYIEGLHLDCTEIRYAVHADFNSGTDLTTFTMKNCDVRHYKASTSFNQAVGCGLGIHVNWLFENVIFRSDIQAIVFRIHNNVDNNSQSNVVIKNCYIVGDGYIKLNSYGNSDKMTSVILTGCNYKTDPVLDKESPEANDNIALYSWGNTKRTE